LKLTLRFDLLDSIPNIAFPPSQALLFLSQSVKSCGDNVTNVLYCLKIAASNAPAAAKAQQLLFDLLILLIKKAPFYTKINFFYPQGL